MALPRISTLLHGIRAMPFLILLGGFAASRMTSPAMAQSSELAQPSESTQSSESTPYWPRFHGPSGNNVSTDTGLLTVWPEEGPELDWTVSGIGSGFSSVTMAHRLMYTAGVKDNQTLISAIDLEGKMVWQVPNGEAWTKSYEGTRGTPTIDGARLYHQSPLGSVICLNAKTGEVIWTINALERFGGENIRWALAESLLVDGEHVICCPGGKQTSVVALNKRTGETVWKSDSLGEKANYATPTLIEIDGLRIILTMTEKHFIGVNAETGKLLFQHPFETKYDINALKPLCHGGHVFISGGYGTTGSELLKLTVAGEDARVEKAWASRDLDNHHGGVLLVDGYLYGASHGFNNSKWICLDWKTGEMKWAERGNGKGSATYADGLFYMMNEKRGVALASASPDQLKVISKFRLPNGGEGASWAHPVVCGGRLYLRWDDRLFAYNVKAQ